jgi:hypothetical protein
VGKTNINKKKNNSFISGANPKIPEKDMYASRPMDIAVLNDDPQSIEVFVFF